MHVIATAGHVDHGKSTLVRALTGMEPDRWDEERRRGLSIGLGFAWTTLPSGDQIAFVDVPGHERFVPTMLGGVGPVPAVLFVVAADEGWMPQSTEHLAALDALGVRHGLLAITRSDLADPAAARADALRRLGASSLRRVESVAVSATRGDGIDELGATLTRVVGALPTPDPRADVRLWVDRCFTITGAGTVATGTLSAGSVGVDDRLLVASTGREVRVRALHTLGEARTRASAVARVAVNLRGIDRTAVRPGEALVTPGAWINTDVLDVALCAADGHDPDRTAELTLHAGTAAVAARVRMLGPGVARLRLRRPLPLRVGDRLLLRDPGRRHVTAGADVLDVRPPALTRRGAAAARGADLHAVLTAAPAETGPAQASPAEVTAAYLRHRGFEQAAELRAMGLAPPAWPSVRGWFLDPRWRSSLAQRLAAELDAWQRAHPLAAGMPADVLRQRLNLPDLALLEAVLAGSELSLTAGQVLRSAAGAPLPAAVQRAVNEITKQLNAEPFAAPSAARLEELGLGPRELAAAQRAGQLVAIAHGVILLPGADDAAVRVLAALAQPFTASQARQALRTSRRVTLPLLELLDRRGITRRLTDGTRMLRKQHENKA